MYGVDKVPDSWFDKIPGGFYKDPTIEEKAKPHGCSGKEDPREHWRRETEGQRNRHSSRTGQKKDKHRAHSNEPRDRRSRRSYDGGADDERKRDDDRDRHRGDHRRRRHSSDHHGSSHNDDRHRRQHDEREHRRVNDGPPYPDYDRNRNNSDRRPNKFDSDPRAVPGPTPPKPQYPRTNGSSSKAATWSSQPSPRSQPQEQASDVYIPYANIYGRPPPKPQQQSSLPSAASRGRSQPSLQQRNSPFAPTSPQGHYQQNRFAQEAPTAAAAGAGAVYDGRSIFNPQDPTKQDGYDPRLDEKLSPRHKDGYGDNERNFTHSAPGMSAGSKHEESYSSNSYGSRSDKGHSRGEYRDRDRHSQSKHDREGRRNDQRGEHDPQGDKGEGRGHSDAGSYSD